jgi:dipeptidyl aminopeptidase/acylaminoacyl peptidase
LGDFIVIGIVRVARAVALASCIFAFVVPCFAQTHPTAEVYGQLPSVSEPSLSPDGMHLATIQPYQGRPVALIYDLSSALGSKIPVAVRYAEGLISRVHWANNQRLLVTIAMNQAVLGDNVNRWDRTVSVDTDGQKPAVMFRDFASRDYNYSASVVTDYDLDDPDHIFMPLVYVDPYDYGTRYSLYKIDVNDGRQTLQERGSSKTDEYFMDGHGHVVARIDQETNPLIDHLLIYKDDNWKEVAKFPADNGHGAGVVGVSIDGTALVQLADSDKPGTRGLVARKLSDNSVSDLFFDPKYDIDYALADPWTKRIIGVAVTADMAEDRYFDPEMEKLQKGLEAAFPGNSAHAVSWDLSQQKVIVQVDGPLQPSTFYYLDRLTHKAIKIATTYRELTAADLGQVKPYPYKARDGLDIPAYLTLPPGKNPKNLPVVILPHGGPTARDDMSFDWESQFLANRGYAVLQPNFRGSSGYGVKFREAGYGEWGLKMQDDVTDGVKKLIADGIADSKRICIVGGSYGGYAALAGAAFTPDLYACAAAWAPVTDLRKMLLTDKRDSGGEDSWLYSAETRYIGDRSKDADKLDAASPAENAAMIKCPVLLMHGEADSTVRIDQSEKMESALLHAHKKVTFIRIEKETHQMDAAASRIRWLTELEKFLKENIGN